MLTGDSGNGKSSLATILSANGYDFISDDFTPISINDSHVYSFPSAISIKESFFNQASSIFDEFEKLGIISKKPNPQADKYRKVFKIWIILNYVKIGV